MSRSVRWALLSCLALSLSGCAAVGSVVMVPFRDVLFGGAYEVDNPWDEGWEPLPSTHDVGDVIVGITFSGGGSRSAYFAACVLEELERAKIPGTDRTFLEEVDYVGGVSGGSLAATYYCLNRRRAGYPEQTKPFYARMRQDMAMDFEVRGLLRTLLYAWPLQLLTYYGLDDVLEAVWNANFLDDRTYGDLDPAGPELLVTAACYTTGLKFVFSRKPVNPLPRAQRAFRDLQMTRGWAAGYEWGGVMSFKTIDSDIAQCPLSTGVAASAAVPGLLKACALRDRAQARRIYLGDGGVYDNLGLETLLQAMRRSITDHPTKRAILLVVDAAGYFDASESAGRLLSVAGFAERTNTIAWLRTAGLAEIALRYSLESMQETFGLTHKPRYEVISLYDKEALDPERSTAPFGRDLLRSLTGVPTRFSISTASIQAIDRATPSVVGSALERLTRRLRVKPGDRKRR